MATLEEQSTDQAVRDVAASMLRAAADALAFHGPDPATLAILGVGFMFAIEDVDKQFPGFKRILVKSLAC